MAESVYVAPLLYKKAVPGGFGIGNDKNDFTQSSSLVIVGVESCAWPTDIVSKSFIFKARRLSLTVPGHCSGKNEITGSVTPSLPSVLAKPTAVEVKLL